MSATRDSRKDTRLAKAREKKQKQQQFGKQGGAATSDPSAMRRWLTSKVISQLIGEKRLLAQRAKFERQRRRNGAAHVVEYFHQVDDAYSHLAAQLLKPLLQRYDITLRCHLVSGPTGGNSVEPELLNRLSSYDAARIAPHYGLNFPVLNEQPDALQLENASGIFAAQDSAQFIDRAAAIGNALWLGDGAALQTMASNFGSSAKKQVQSSLAKGNARRNALQHYSGAMFYYAGEWYWGVDRLYHLEKRLIELGAARTATKTSTSAGAAPTLLAPRPSLAAGELVDNGSLTLEIYPSLRSPYTAISFDRAVELARDSGLKLVVRPVLPMVMRGVPVTRQKGLYIFRDAAREARAANMPFGNFYDPIGEPVLRCYSLYPWACEHDKGVELLSAFLRAAFIQGVNTNSERGLKHVVEAAGLDWQSAQKKLGDSSWETLLEKNRLAMYEAGLWGVPSFRLLDKNGNQMLALWGQDRLWLIAREIQSLLKAAH